MQSLADREEEVILPLQKPLHPDCRVLEPYLRRIDETRWYTNRGSLVREYEARLSEVFGCYVAAVSSCTMGLVAALIELGYNRKHIRMPSWTFIATANAVKLAGFLPYLCDIDLETFISVAEFGEPPRCATLVDGAGAFDSIMQQNPKDRGEVCVISTHATKPFSTAEGGFVLSRSKYFTEQILALINHGLDEFRRAANGGLNGKMSEYHAAIGLASLDQWTETRARWLDTEKRYAKALGRYPRDYVASVYPCEVFASVEETMPAINKAGIGTRKMWGNGVHKYAAYVNCPRTDMKKTDYKADHTLFLPFYIDMTDSEMQYVADKLGEIL